MIAPDYEGRALVSLKGEGGKGTKDISTSHIMTPVFGSSMTGVKPFGFSVVVKGGFFWSAVAQTLVV